MVLGVGVTGPKLLLRIGKGKERLIDLDRVQRPRNQGCCRLV